MRIDQHTDNMLRALEDYYQEEIRKTGLSQTLNTSAVVKTAIEREYNRVRRLQKKQNKENV